MTSDDNNFCQKKTMHAFNLLVLLLICTYVSIKFKYEVNELYLNILIVSSFHEQSNRQTGHEDSRNVNSIG